MIYKIHIGPSIHEHSFTTDFGASRSARTKTVAVSNDSAVALFLFNRWPRLRIHLSEQTGRNEHNVWFHRVVVWIFKDATQQEPCAVLINVDDPMALPQWHLWKPYFDNHPANPEIRETK